MPDKFDNFIAGVQGGRTNFETMVNSPAKGKNPAARARKTAAASSVSPEEKKALDDIRNSRRGRKKSGEDGGASYKRVGFECREDLLESFDIIPYKVGKTRKELFEEALEYIIKKYS